MTKFKMKLKLTGFELEIEGNREDIPQIAQAVGQQIVGMLDPAASIVSGTAPAQHPPQATPQFIEATPIRKKRRKTTSATTNTSETEKIPTILNWKHDPSKWSSPTQSWSTLDKAIWTLYVAEQETKETELTVRQISDTFNTHFKQAKTVRVPNVTRDLGNKKGGKEALVGENTTVSPSKWYLTESGKLHATKLISEGKS